MSLHHFFTRKDVTTRTKMQVEAALNTAAGKQRQIVHATFSAAQSNTKTTALALTGSRNFIPVMTAPPNINVDSRSFSNITGSNISFGSNNNSNNNNNNSSNNNSNNATNSNKKSNLKLNIYLFTVQSVILSFFFLFPSKTSPCMSECKRTPCQYSD